MPGDGEPPRFDASRPNMARVRDYLLGGKDNFAADRELAEMMTDPEKGHAGLRLLTREQQQFLLKATRWVTAMKGVAQFASIGCGLPSRPAVHDSARSADPAARVAYVDHDPVVLAHARALLATGDGLAAGDADPADPGAVLKVLAELEDESGAKVIDFGEPAGLLLGGSLSAMDAGTARAAVAAYAGALAPGSAVVISCLSYADEELAARLAGMAAAVGCWVNHSLADVGSFFSAGGLRIVRGRADDVHSWPLLPSGNRRDAMVAGGVGLKDLAPPTCCNTASRTEIPRRWGIRHCHPDPPNCSANSRLAAMYPLVSHASGV